MENNNIPDILTQVSKEKFRRRVMIGSRLVAVALIIAIFFIGFVQIKYVKEFNEMRAEYGSNAYCYYCGLEKGKSCSCNFLQPGEVATDEYLETIAFGNIQPCEDRNKKINDIDLSNIKIDN